MVAESSPCKVAKMSSYQENNIESESDEPQTVAKSQNLRNYHEKSGEKPTLDSFDKIFAEQHKSMEEVYQSSKAQFLRDLKSFNPDDIEREEEYIMTYMNENNL